MRSTTVKLSEISKHSTRRLDAKYWVGKSEGKIAHKKDASGLLIEDDVNGKIMLTTAEKSEYNAVKVEAVRVSKLLSDVTRKYDVK